MGRERILYNPAFHTPISSLHADFFSETYCVQIILSPNINYSYQAEVMKPIINLCIFILTVALLAGCDNNRRNAEQIVRKVKVETVQLADTIRVKTFSGRVREAAEVNISFRVAGPIANIAVKEGDYVRAGQLVAEMDTRDYEVQLQVAQARYEQVKAEAERTIELHRRQSVSSGEYEKAVAGLKMVESQLKHARNQLNDTRLTAPVAGYIQKINFRPRELIDAGMPLGTLLDVSEFQVEANIPASLLLNRDYITDISGIIPVAGEETIPLILLSISPRAGQNQLYRMLMGMDMKAQKRLAAGMDIKIHITLRQNEEPCVCVPLSALFNRDGKTCVWVYDADKQLVNLREVTTDRLIGNGRILITHGLQQGEQVVVAGVSLLTDQEKVEPMEPLSETNVGGLL